LGIKTVTARFHHTYAILFAFPALVLAASDRPTAEWVLHLGGNVVVEGSAERIWDPARLPAGDFQLRRIPDALR